ncbi:MAG: glycosyltransferase family 2 protein [Candidatus Methylomirabilales bacterium]
MSSPMRVTAIIPALDEEGAIGETVARLDRTLIQHIIVVDNGSCDRTAERASAAGARVVFEPHRGYGRACLAGVRAAGPDGILVFLDGDGSDVPEDVARVLEPIRQGTADLMLGSRLRGRWEPGALSAHQRWGNRLVLVLVRLLDGVRLTDAVPSAPSGRWRWRALGCPTRRMDGPLKWSERRPGMACGLRRFP